MEDNPYKAPESNLEVLSDVVEHEFYVVSIKKFAILFFITMGLYSIYWFYKNWKEYRNTHGVRLWPIPRAIFSIFFTHSLFRKIQDNLLYKGIDYEWSPGGMATMYVLLAIVSNILDRMSMKEIGSPITDFLSLMILPLLYIPLVKAQKAVNISQGDPDGRLNEVFTPANYIWIVIGALFWLVALLGFLVMFGLVNIE